MTVEVNGKPYELVELCEPNKNETHGIIAIFKVRLYIDYNGTEKDISLKEYEREMKNFMDREDTNKYALLELKEYINYFYFTFFDKKEEIIDVAKDYIEDYEKQRKQDFLKELEKAQKQEQKTKLESNLVDAFLNLDRDGLENYENALDKLVMYLVNEKGEHHENNEQEDTKNQYQSYARTI